MHRKLLLTVSIIVVFVIGCSSDTSKKPKINIVQGTIEIPNATGFFDFGAVQVGKSGSAITFTVENIGKGNLVLDGSPEKVIQHCLEPEHFTIVQTGLSAKIPKKTSSTFAIIFTPKSYGVKNSTILIPNNDKKRNPYTFKISGFATKVENDINGDGFQDLVVGAYFDDDSGLDSGSVYVFFGKDNHAPEIDASEADLILRGEDVDDHFGFRFSTDGDVNNDGINDIVVGAYWNDNGGEKSGSVYIFFGKTNWAATIHASNADVILVGESANDWFGSSVSSAGDLNGDGINDILVGAYRDDDGGYESGCAFIFFGTENWDVVIFAEDADVKIVGEDINDYFGHALTAGDINNDGFDDAVIGSWFADNGGAYSGSVYIFFGSNNWDANIDATDSDVQLNGENPSDRFGVTVSSAGDVNADGIADVVVGAYFHNSNGAISGSTYVFLGKLSWASVIDASNADVKLNGEASGDSFGVNVSTAGDVNGDNIEDLIIGAFTDDNNANNAGCAFVYFGRSNWLTSYETTDADVILVGENEDDNFGINLYSGIDFNGNGVNDIVVGANFADGGGDKSGNAYIFFGSQNWNTNILASNANVKLIGADIGDQFGVCVSSR